MKIADTFKIFTSKHINKNNYTILPTCNKSNLYATASCTVPLPATSAPISSTQKSYNYQTKHISVDDKKKLVLLYNKISYFLSEIYDEYKIKYDENALFINELVTVTTQYLLKTVTRHNEDKILHLDEFFDKEDYLSYKFIEYIQDKISSNDFDIIRNEWLLGVDSEHSAFLILKDLTVMIPSLEMKYKKFKDRDRKILNKMADIKKKMNKYGY